MHVPFVKPTWTVSVQTHHSGCFDSESHWCVRVLLLMYLHVVQLHISFWVAQICLCSWKQIRNLLSPSLKGWVGYVKECLKEICAVTRGAFCTTSEKIMRQDASVSCSLHSPWLCERFSGEWLTMNNYLCLRSLPSQHIHMAAESSSAFSNTAFLNRLCLY